MVNRRLSDSMCVVCTTGTRYMVVDCGGGTVDITVHEMENDSGNLRELYKAAGGPYGSTGKSLAHSSTLAIALSI